jgi:hypothetical protein
MDKKIGTYKTICPHELQWFLMDNAGRILEIKCEFISDGRKKVPLFTIKAEDVE